MFCYTHKNFAYVKVPKNGCMSYSTFLENNGWTKTDLFFNDLDVDNTIFFGHITEPNKRHTRGLAQYLINTNQVSLLDSSVSHLLVSGVFDEHCYSVHMMLPHLVNKIKWIPLDYSHDKFDGNHLTNMFFKENGINLHYSDADRLNVADEQKILMYSKIDNLKLKYNQDYQKLVKNFLEPDIKLHSDAIHLYNQVNLDVI